MKRMNTADLCGFLRDLSTAGMAVESLLASNLVRTPNLIVLARLFPRLNKRTSNVGLNMVILST